MTTDNDKAMVMAMPNAKATAMVKAAPMTVAVATAMDVVKVTAEVQIWLCYGYGWVAMWHG